MELEEAKERVNKIKENWHDLLHEKYCYIEDDEEALQTVLQELDRLQEENEKLEKANRVYINSIQSITPVLLKDYVEKDKIRELIEELNKLLPDIDYRDIKDKQEREYYKKEYHKVVAQINVLENLLKEE